VFWGSPLWARVRRLALTGVLLAVMVWGLRARPGVLTSPSRAVSPVPVLILAAICVAGAMVLFAVAVRDPRRRRHRDREPEPVAAPPPAWWGMLQVLTAILVAFLLLAVVFWAAVHPGGGVTGSEGAGPVPAPSGVTTGTGAASPIDSAWLPEALSVWLPEALVALSLAAATGLTLRSMLRRRTRADPSTSPALVSAQPERPGSWQTPAGGDARGDVVAAFHEFEQDAARLGVPVEPPETAYDIARHPVTVHAADPNTIADLTALFHRARYSSETITDADQERAQVLLTRIHAQLGRPS